MRAQRKVGSGYGWVIVGVGMLSMAVKTSVWVSGGLFLVPITRDTDWSRTAVSAAISLFVLGRGMWSPVVGSLIRVWGPRRVMPLAALILAGGLLAQSAVHSVLGFSFLMLFLVSLGTAGIGDVANFTAVQAWFSDRRGMALGLVGTGGGLGLALLGPLIQWFIHTLGWRGAYQALAAVVLLLAPLNLLLQRQPPRGVQSPISADLATVGRGSGASSLLHQRTFWLILVGRMSASSAVHLVVLHQAAYLIDRGFSSEVISTALGSLGLVAIVGRTASGWLSDTVGTVRASAVVIASMMLAIGFLVIAGLSGRLWHVYLFGILFGSSIGVPSILFAGEMVDLFGTQVFGTAMGLLVLAGGLGGAAGTVAGGMIYDATGDYLSSFGAAAIGVLLTFACIWTVTPGGWRGSHTSP